MKTVNEKLMNDVVKHRQIAVGVEKQIQRELWKHVETAKKEVLDKLVAATARPLKKKDIALLMTQVRVDLSKAQDRVTKALGKQLNQVYSAEENVAGTLLTATLPVVLAQKVIMRKTPVRVVKDVLSMPVHGVTYEQAIANMFDRLRVRVDKEAQGAFGEAFHQNLLAGKSFGVAKKEALDASKILAGRLGDLSKGATKQLNRDLKMIVNGHVQRALDAAQTKVFKSNAHLLQGVVYTATLDQLTCPVCAALDGTMYWMGEVPEGKDGELFEDKPALPMHPNCRCCYAPIVRSWQSLPAKDISEPTKKILDGDIPKPKTYAQWFKEQNESTQVDILGPKKYELWKSGQVKLSDMGTMDRPVSVEELQEKAGAKAQKAAQTATVTEEGESAQQLYERYMVERKGDFSGLLDAAMKEANDDVTPFGVMQKVFKYEQPWKLTDVKVLLKSIVEDSKATGISQEKLMTLIKADLERYVTDYATGYRKEMQEKAATLVKLDSKLKAMAKGELSLSEISQVKETLYDCRMAVSGEWDKIVGNMQEAEQRLKLAKKNLLQADVTLEQREILRLAKETFEIEQEKYQEVMLKIAKHNDGLEYWFSVAKTETKKLAELEAQKNIKKGTKKSAYEYTTEASKKSNLTVGDTEYEDWLRSLSDDELEAFEDWTSSGYAKIRSYQLGREVPPGDIPWIKNELAIMEKAVERVQPYEGKVYRGAVLNPAKVERMRPGGSVTFDSFNSSSTDKSTAANFMKWSHSKHPDRVAVRFTIENKTGVRIEEVSTHAGEKEVLLRPGADYKIVAVEEKKYMDGAGNIKPYWEVSLKEVFLK